MIPTPRETLTEPLEIRSLEIREIKVFRADRRMDERGYVVPYSQRGLAEAGVEFKVVHENHCWSARAGTVRGFHYQLPPYGQGKLIRVTRGRVEIEPEGWNQILVPPGFAHCYCTLTDDVEVIFKLDCEYAPSYARGLAWNDPDLGVDWPLAEAHAIVLDRDRRRPRFRDLTELFP